MRRIGWCFGLVMMGLGCGDSASSTGGGGAGGEGATTPQGGGGEAGSTQGGGGSGGTGGSGGAQGGEGGAGGGGGVPAALGAPCDEANQCASGFCSDGVCCDAACDGGCDACVEQITGEPDGTCSLLDVGAVCRPALSLCDFSEACDGTSAECPDDEIVTKAGFPCRASTGPCDPAEVCDGLTTVCPGDMIAAAGVECRASLGDCDPAEVCDGAGVECPVDVYDGMGTLCRDAQGVCDDIEVCTGVDPQCPADSKRPSSTVCNASNGACDVSESCDGLNDDCPVDAFLPDGTPSTCSLYVCDGTMASCPAACVTTADCVAGYGCLGNDCVPVKRVFVTSTVTTGSLGGLAGADATCNARAQAAGLPGTFKAWLSAGGATPLTTFTQSSVPYVRLDGVRVADDFADLVDTNVDAPINVNELGASYGNGFLPVWTGTNSLGNQQSVNCSGWTTGNSAIGGWIGRTDVSTFEWTSYNAQPCNVTARLYCFEQ